MAQENICCQELLADLSKTVECPVCLDTVQVPFKQCTRGHVICNGCIQDKNRPLCPLCRAAVNVENPVCVKNILELLPRSCKYSDRGCRELARLGDEHDRFCGYRPDYCQECNGIFSLLELPGHYETVHPKVLIMSVTANVCLDFHAPWLLKWLPVYLFGHWFWIRLLNDVDNKQLHITFQAKFIEKPLNDFYCRVTFEKDELVYTHTLKAEDRTAVVPASSLSQLYILRIDKCVLNSLTENKNLKYNLHFFKKPLQ